MEIRDRGGMKKKILITGLPRSGKSTILEKVINEIDNKKGFITREVRANGERTGFEIVTDDGRKKMLSSIDFNSLHKVSRYFVDVDGLDEMVATLMDYGKELLYIDEIGQMELFSENFKELVTNYLDSDNVFIATVSKVYEDDFIRRIKSRKDVLLYEITPENREEKLIEIKDYLNGLLK